MGDGGPDGVFFSNGPGDPAAADLTLLRQVLERRIPFFGICFGNQLLGRALGLGTYKLKYGHRGINQPVMDLTTGKVEVTAHNHGFAIAWDGALSEPAHTAYGQVRVSHICLNDEVVEGLECLDVPAYSVQYHPEAAAGPHDAAYLFDRFTTAAWTGGQLMPRREDITSVLVIGSGPDRHRPGVRVRLLRHPGLPRAARRGRAGRARQQQPGDDHDRPRVRRRDLRRADHPGRRRADHRQGAARRGARHPRRPDRAQHRDGAARARRPGQVRRARSSVPTSRRSASARTARRSRGSCSGAAPRWPARASPTP